MSTRVPSFCAGRLLAGLALLAGCVATHAAEVCAVTTRSDAVAVLVCAPTASQQQWRDAGTAACKGRTSCNAWIWNDASKAPVIAPLKDTDLPKAQSGAASAIWVADTAQLIVLRKTK